VSPRPRRRARPRPTRRRVRARHSTSPAKRSCWPVRRDRRAGPVTPTAAEGAAAGGSGTTRTTLPRRARVRAIDLGASPWGNAVGRARGHARRRRSESTSRPSSSRSSSIPTGLSRRRPSCQTPVTASDGPPSRARSTPDSSPPAIATADRSAPSRLPSWFGSPADGASTPCISMSDTLSLLACLGRRLTRTGLVMRVFSSGSISGRNRCCVRRQPLEGSA